jgi:branched-chain amino acid transport system substrate-binding protein
MVVTRPGGVGIAPAAGTVWVASGIDGTVSRVDRAEAGAADTLELGYEALNVSAGRDALWVALGSPIQPLATSADGFQPVGAPPCGRLQYQGPGQPDVLVVVDMPLRSRPPDRVRTIARVAQTIVADRGYRAGRWGVGLQVCDDSTAQSRGWQPEQCVTNMRAYAVNRAVVGVIGPHNSGCAQIAIPTASTAPGGPLAMVSPSNDFLGLTAPAPTDPGGLERLYPDGRRGYVRVYPSGGALGDAEVRVALDGGARRAAILEDPAAGAYTIEQAEAFAGAARRAGLDVVLRPAWQAKARSYAAIGERLARRGVDVVFVAGLWQDNGYAVLADLHAAAPGIQVVVPEGFVDVGELVRALGVRSAPWLHVVVPGLPADRLDPSWRALLDGVGGDGYWGPYAAAATVAMLDAIARSDGTRADVAAKLRTTSLPDGPFGPIVFNRSGDVAAPPFTVLHLAPGGTGMHPDRPDFADGMAVERVLPQPATGCGSGSGSSLASGWAARSCATEITTAPSRATPRPATARTACHIGERSRDSSRISAPRATLTTGLATDTVATEGTRRPVASESCWIRKPTTPAMHITQNCQSPRTSRPSTCQDSTTGFISTAARPNRMPATAPSPPAFTVGLPRFARIPRTTQTTTMIPIATTQSEVGALFTPPAGSPNEPKRTRPATISTAPPTCVQVTFWPVRK